MKREEGSASRTGLAAPLARGLAWCPAPRPATRQSHKVRKAMLVVSFFSFRLPQPSIGQVALFVSTFRLPQQGREHRGAVYVLSQCCGILSIYRCALPPSRNRNDFESQRFSGDFRARPLRQRKNAFKPSSQERSSSRCNACLLFSHLLTVGTKRKSFHGSHS